MDSTLVFGVPLLFTLAILTAMLVVLVVNILFAFRLQTGAERPPSMPKVSVLMPARNEEANLPTTLPALIAALPEGSELLVLNDHSADRTAEIAKDLGARVLDSRKLPPGWTGKNWACHQLAEASSGEILLFVDADVTAGAQSIMQTAALMEREGLDVLSAFPRQVLESMLERAVLPFLMHLPVTLILPLVTVTRLQSPRFAAANGQWLSFRREAYFALGGHARRPSEVLEDVEFAIHAKKMGKRLGIAYGTQSLSVRMYRKNSDLIEGLTKNLALLLGRTTSKVFSRSTFLFFVFITPLLYPWFAPGNPLAWLPLLLLTALRIGSALLMRSGWREILLHPFGAIGILFLILRSFVHVRRGTAQWKGRVLS